MAFDDILGIPISFEDKEEKKPTVVEKKKDVWDTEKYWSLDLDDLWKSDNPQKPDPPKRRGGNTGPAPQNKEEDDEVATDSPTDEDLPTLDPEDDYDDDEADLDDFIDDMDDMDDMEDVKDDDADADNDVAVYRGSPGNRPTTDPNLLLLN